MEVKVNQFEFCGISFLFIMLQNLSIMVFSISQIFAFMLPEYINYADNFADYGEN